MPKHILHKYTFDQIIENLDIAIQSGYVYKKEKDDLTLYNYTEKCTYERYWNDFTLSARGLVLCLDKKKIVALPFPKFFNYGETGYDIPTERYSSTDKLDGSLGIIYYWNNKWNVCTRGSFDSPQAQWAEKWFDEHFYMKNFNEIANDLTILAEIIYPENKIVVNYGDIKELFFLSSYNRETFEEFDVRLGLTRLIPYDQNLYSFEYLIEECKKLPASSEGFVIKFESGLRLKLKGDEYCRVHRLISNTTPLAIWDSMRMCDNLDKIREQLPEEFHIDFDNIVKILENTIDYIIYLIGSIYRETFYWSDKNLGEYINENSTRPELRFLFPARKNNFLEEHKKPGKARNSIFKTFRPTGNKLPGYVPSSVMNRFGKE